MSKEIVVKKFGGSSLADADGCRRVANIVRMDPACRVVVVSAPGVCEGYPVKMTDTLIEIARTIVNGLEGPVFEGVRPTWRADLWCDNVSLRFGSLMDNLNRLEPKRLQLNWQFTTDELCAHVRSLAAQGDLECAEAYLASRGEWYMAKIMAAYLNATFVDAADVIRLKDDGSVDETATARLIVQHCAGHELVVIPGFYGATEDGTILTLGRGGSDVTMALVARALSARAEKWTDVPGVFEAPPRIVPNARPIVVLSAPEMRELAAGGASVLHPDAVRYTRVGLGMPAVPVRVLNTRDVGASGTLIVTDPTLDSTVPLGSVVGIATRGGFVTIRIYEMGMNDKLGYAADVLELLSDLGLSVDHVVTGEDSMAITLHASAIPTGWTIQDLWNRLANQRSEEAVIAVEEAIAMVVVVGPGIRLARGVLHTITATLMKLGVTPTMLSQGASTDSIIIGVPMESAASVVRAFHAAFFKR